ncbi:UvrB/UvrC motif-containing protein [Patescibacteria group bacterium]|nr:UvrB/UvrC motif-containing protein [Patescibacteria group bacterium]
MNRFADTIRNLPDAPGVYLFYNFQNEVIYVGKATSLRDRVRSYFPSSLRCAEQVPISRPIEGMIHEVKKISHAEIGSVLEAVILEARYIKKYLPKYNVLGRDDKSWNYLCVTNDEFPKLVPVREHELKLIEKKYAKIFGPYPGLNTKEAIRILRRLFSISICEPNQKRPCLYYQMGQCLGVCARQITSKDYKKKVIAPLTAFLGGSKKRLIKQLEKQMKKASNERNFEEAARLRNQLGALQRIRDIALLNKSFIEIPQMRRPSKEEYRIEGYDISNLGESGKVGSMVVFDANGPVKSQYRKFTIRTVVGQSDVDCMAEIIERRLKHSEWPMPDIFLIDGGKPQVNRVVKILREKQILTPVVGIAKGPKRMKNEFFVSAPQKDTILDWVENNKNILIQTRDEAHRFAIKFQREKKKI